MIRQDSSQYPKGFENDVAQSSRACDKENTRSSARELTSANIPILQLKNPLMSLGKFFARISKTKAHRVETVGKIVYCVRWVVEQRGENT